MCPNLEFLVQVLPEEKVFQSYSKWDDSMFRFQFPTFKSFLIGCGNVAPAKGIERTIASCKAGKQPSEKSGRRGCDDNGMKMLLWKDLANYFNRSLRDNLNYQSYSYLKPKNTLHFHNVQTCDTMLIG